MDDVSDSSSLHRGTGRRSRRSAIPVPSDTGMSVSVLPEPVLKAPPPPHPLPHTRTEQRRADAVSSSRPHRYPPCPLWGPARPAGGWPAARGWWPDRPAASVLGAATPATAAAAGARACVTHKHTPARCHTRCHTSATTTTFQVDPIILGPSQDAKIRVSVDRAQRLRRSAPPPLPCPVPDPQIPELWRPEMGARWVVPRQHNSRSSHQGDQVIQVPLYSATLSTYAGMPLPC
jgi:hypothetical protein